MQNPLYKESLFSTHESPTPAPRGWREAAHAPESVTAYVDALRVESVAHRTLGRRQTRRNEAESRRKVKEFAVRQEIHVAIRVRSNRRAARIAQLGRKFSRKRRDVGAVNAHESVSKARDSCVCVCREVEHVVTQERMVPRSIHGANASELVEVDPVATLRDRIDEVCERARRNK